MRIIRRFVFESLLTYYLNAILYKLIYRLLRIN